MASFFHFNEENPLQVTVALMNDIGEENPGLQNFI